MEFNLYHWNSTTDKLTAGRAKLCGMDNHVIVSKTGKRYYIPKKFKDNGYQSTIIASLKQRVKENNLPNVGQEIHIEL